MKLAPLLGRERDLEGLAYHLGNDVGLEQAHGILGYRLEDPGEIQHLVRFLVQACGGGLPGDCYQRGMVHVGVGHPGQQIGCPGTQRGETDACLPGQAAVDIGHEGRTLFMAHGDKADGGIQQGIHDVEVFLAGDTEDVLHPLVFQATHKQFGCFHAVTRR